MIKKWIPKEPNITEVEHLINQTNASRYLCSALVNRGLTSFDETLKFLKPNIKNLHDPMLMKDIKKAVVRIKRAMRESEQIVVYGDYD